MRCGVLSVQALVIVLGTAAYSFGEATWFDEQPPAEVPLAPVEAQPVPVEPQPELLPPCPPPTPSPFAGPLCERPGLLGDPYCWRRDLAGHGVNFFGDLTQYYQGVTSGGLDQRFLYGWRADYLVDLDTGKLGLWEGGMIDIRGESRLGQDTSSIDGTVSPTNVGLLLPYPNRDVTAITGVQYTHIVSEDLLVFGGKLNVFDGTPATYSQGLRLNKFSNAALVFNLAAILVPPSTLGAGFVKLKDHEPNLTFIVLDSRYNPTTSGIENAFSNGVLLYGEYQIKTNFWDLPGHSAFGFVYSNATRRSLEPNWWVNFPSPPPGPLPTTDNTWTATYRFDQVVFVDPCNEKRNMAMLGQFGLADGNPNPVDWFASIAALINGPITTRPNDVLGIGYYHMGLTNRGVLDALGFGAEDGVELYYNFQVTPWLHVTPDLQIIDPSRTVNDTSVLFGVRARVTF